MDDSLSLIEDRFRESIEATQKTRIANELLAAAECMVGCLKSGKKILFCGNGGSAEQAAHFAGELAGRFKRNRKPFAAIALGTNLNLLTAVANDFDFKDVFSREVEAVGCRGDVLVALSTSGNSPNVLKAVEAARKMGIITIGFCGEGGILKEKTDQALKVASTDTPRIQETHLLFIHVISELVEKKMAEEK